MALANGNHEAYTPQSILVTGGAGFIASHVTKLLVTKYPQYKVESPCGQHAPLLIISPQLAAHLIEAQHAGQTVNLAPSPVLPAGGGS